LRKGLRTLSKLKQELHTKLDLTRIADTRDGTNRADRRDIGRRIREICVIRHIEELGAELSCNSLRDCEILQCGNVDNDVTGPNKAFRAMLP
jgi:hypothetical protein